MVKFFVISIMLVVSVILEIVAFHSLVPHYGTNLSSEIDSTMERLKGCGDTHLNLAIEHAMKEPVIYERPKM